MGIQRKYVIGIIDHDKIPAVNEIIFSYSKVFQQSTSDMYFAKMPLNPNKFIFDATFFQLEAENESSLNKKVEDLIKALDELTHDYVLKDEESGKLLSVVEDGGKLLVKFDKVKFINKGTFKEIDDLKQIKTDFGYTRGFNPDFRPLEDRSVEGSKLSSEIIYLISDSPENLSKFTEYICDKLLEINPDFEMEFTHFRKA